MIWSFWLHATISAEGCWRPMSSNTDWSWAMTCDLHCKYIIDQWWYKMLGALVMEFCNDTTMEFVSAGPCVCLLQYSNNSISSKLYLNFNTLLKASLSHPFRASCESWCCNKLVAMTWKPFDFLGSIVFPAAKSHSVNWIEIMWQWPERFSCVSIAPMIARSRLVRSWSRRAQCTVFNSNNVWMN